MPVSLLIATSAHHVGFGLLSLFIKGRGKQTRGRSWFELCPGGSRDVCFTARSGLGRRPGEVGGAEGSVPALGAAGALSQPWDFLLASGPPLPPGRRGGKQRGGSSSAPHPTAYFFRSVLERGRWDSPPLLLLQHMGSKSFSAAASPPPGPPLPGPPGPDPAEVRC